MAISNIYYCLFNERDISKLLYLYFNFNYDQFRNSWKLQFIVHNVLRNEFIYEILNMSWFLLNIHNLSEN